MPEIIATPKKRVQWEARLVSEYVSHTYPNDRQLFQVRVGPVNPRLRDQDLTPAEIKMLGVWRPRLDALVIRPDSLIAIEASVVLDLGKPSQLDTYRDLLPNTPELRDLAHLPITAILLSLLDYDLLRLQATKYGLAFVVYRPKWCAECIDARAPRSGADKRLFD